MEGLLVTVKKTVRRRAPRLVGLAGAVVLSSSLSFPVMAPVAAEPTSGGTFNTVAEMAQASGASGTLTTLGDEAPGDGGGLTYDVQSTSPEGALGAVSVMLADGQWAVPQGLPAGPAVGADGTAANDVVARTQSFVNAGGSLVSDASRPTPLSGANVRASGSAPYAITSSALVGMVLSGWDYSHTTYAADQNTQVGYRADVGQDLSGSWKPDDLAGWFHSQGRLWLNTDGSISPGDIVFFSNPLPGGQGESGSAPAQSTVFGNVYDVGIYVGNNQVVRRVPPRRRPWTRRRWPKWLWWRARSGPPPLVARPPRRISSAPALAAAVRVPGVALRRRPRRPRRRPRPKRSLSRARLRGPRPPTAAQCRTARAPARSPRAGPGAATTTRSWWVLVAARTRRGARAPLSGLRPRVFGSGGCR